MIDVKDRIIQYPRRFKLTLVEGETDVYELTPVTGTVQEEGTPINAELFDSISADITAEANTRAAADTTLKNKIDAETTARENAVKAVNDKADAHIARTDNPHSVTAAQIGAEPAFDKNSAFNKNFGTESGTVCEGNDGRLEGNVKYTAQSLSEEQQAQARTNINALSADEADIRYIPVDCDHEYEITGYTGHEENLEVPEQCQVLVSKIKGQTGRLSPNLANNALFEINDSTMNNSANPIQLGVGDYSISISGATFSFGQWQIIINDIVVFTFDLTTNLQAPFSVSTPSSFRIYANNGSPNAKIMLVSGTYTAETMPAYQPYNKMLVNSKVKNVLSTGKNLYSGKNDLDWTPGYLENKYPLYLGKGTYSICVYAENPSGTNQYQFQGLDEYGNEVFSTQEIPVNTGAAIEVTIPISKILLYVNTTGHIKVMLNYGSSSLPYEPYISDDTFGVDIEITQFGEVDNISKTFNEYGSDSVITLNGSEGWSQETIPSGGNRFFIYGFISGGGGNILTINTASNWIDVSANDTWGGYEGLSCDGLSIHIVNPAYSTLEEFKAWLAANPIQFIYRLATPRIQTTVDIQAGYSAHKGGLQQQVIEGDYLPYILTKNYPISMAAQTAILMEVDRKQSILINKNAADIAQKATKIAANTEAIEKITDGTTTVGDSKKFDGKTSDNFALISGSYSAMSVGYATSAGSAGSADTANNANNADTAKNYSSDGTIKQKFDSIEERLSSLGFKQGVVTADYLQSYTLKRQGSCVIGELVFSGVDTLTALPTQLCVLPENFRPKEILSFGSYAQNFSDLNFVPVGITVQIDTEGVISYSKGNYNNVQYLVIILGFEANSL